MRLISLLASFLLSFNVSYGSTSKSPPAKPEKFKRVMVVVLENTDLSYALQQKFLKKLVNDGALLKNFSAETHPSLPNYVAMVAGDTMGVTDDEIYSLVGRHLGDLLESSNHSWKNYAEGFPGDCYLLKRKAKYARKHVPFLNFKNVVDDRTRCREHVVNADQLDRDLAANALPDFSFYTPDLDNDGHDTGVAIADRWLEKRFGPLIANPQFIQDTLLIITFDENDGSPGNKIATVLYGSGVKPGTVSQKAYNHYSLLKTIEDRWKLGDLGRGDAKAQPITDVWK